MRSEKEIFELFLNFAQEDERIRIVTLEGSRTNPTIPDDGFKDYDLSYFVTDMKPYQQNDEWLDIFGKRLILQKPEDMELYPPELGNWYSYLMLFEDGNKVDLSLIPLEKTDEYFENHDGLVEVLIDKDERILTNPIPTDRQYWIQKPSAAKFDDCCNEFWWVSTYVAKGLARKELLFAVDHLNQIIRPSLLLMMSWKIGSEKGYQFSLGKNYKFIKKFLPEEDWEDLIKTFRCDGYEECWQALFLCHKLFRKYSNELASFHRYQYPDYDEKVSVYIKKIYQQDLEVDV